MHKMLALSISFFCSTQVWAQNKSFQYFDGKDIDYWNEGKVVKESWLGLNDETTIDSKKENLKDSEKLFSGSTAIRAKDTSKFNWKNYKDPNNPEFWDDGGDWIPPRPFREAVINPTKENIDSYLQWMVLKTSLIDRFNVSLRNVTHQNDQKIQNKLNFDWTKVRIAYFYQSTCPHCRNSIPIIEKIKKSGADVEFIQLDAQKNPPIHARSIPYTKELDDMFHINSTPTWVLKIGNAYTQIVGEQSIETLEQSAKQLQKESLL